MNLLRNSFLALTIVPVIIAAGCGGGGSASSAATSTTPSQPTQPIQPATSNVAISSPASGASVSSPFALAASATTCNSQTVTSIGYALDGGLTYTTTNGTTLSAQVAAAAGAHTVNIVAYGNSGASCNASENVVVTAPAKTGSDLAISSPANGATVTSPFSLTASGTTCNGQSITSIGYSLDSGNTTTLTGSAINAASVTAAAGAHTVYVKAWGSSGAECDANISITVSAPPATGSASLVPSNAISVNNIEQMSTWKYNHDPGTPGSSTGTMATVTPPTPLNSTSGTARQFSTSFSGSGGEIYYISIGADTAATNFFWDGWVYVDNSVSSIGNLELDMNQVIANGDTIIYGFQCDGYSGTWDYTENSGTVTNHSSKWLHATSAPCDVRTWTPNAWHHIQISYSHDSSGNVTYNSVWLDGNQEQINKTVPSEFALGWGTTLLTNFQVDGLGAGSNTIYLDNLTISRW